MFLRNGGSYPSTRLYADMTQKTTICIFTVMEILDYTSGNAWSVTLKVSRDSFTFSSSYITVLICIYCIGFIYFFCLWGIPITDSDLLSSEGRGHSYFPLPPYSQLCRLGGGRRRGREKEGERPEGRGRRLRSVSSILDETVLPTFL